MPENTSDRTFSVCETNMPIEYKEKCVMCFKN